MSAPTVERFASKSMSTLALVLCSLGLTGQAQSSEKAFQVKTLGDFENCLRQEYNHENCLIALEKYVRATPKDAMKAGKLARLNFNAPVSLRFFETASKQNNKGFCQDEDLQLAVLSGLGLPTSYPDAERARALFSGKCYPEHESAVIKSVNNADRSSYLLDNACPILKKHNQTPASCQPVEEAKPEPKKEEARLPSIDKSQVKLGVVKVYQGPEGERVTLAPIQGGDLYLIRFEGTTSPWEGKVLLHKREDKGNDNADFWTEKDGNRWNSVIRRNGMEVYVPGYKSGNGFNIGYAEKLSRDADPAALLKAYQP